MSDKHPKSQHPSDADLRGNPGIGTSKGPEMPEGETTSEGDVMNDTTPEGGIDPNQRGRTNK